MDAKKRETFFRKGRDGNQAKTEYELHGLKLSVLQHRRKGLAVLTVATRKAHSGALVTSASVSCEEVQDGTTFKTQVYGIGSDYFARPIIAPGVRATEKAVERQHLAALEMLPRLLEEVVAFYEQKIAREKRDFPTQCEEG